MRWSADGIKTMRCSEKGGVMMKRTVSMKQDKGSLSFSVTGYIVMTLITIVCLVPFWLLIVGSFSDEHMILTQGYKARPLFSGCVSIHIPGLGETRYRLWRNHACYGCGYAGLSFLHLNDRVCADAKRLCSTKQSRIFHLLYYSV